MRYLDVWNRKIHKQKVEQITRDLGRIGEVLLNWVHEFLFGIMKKFMK